MRPAYACGFPVPVEEEDFEPFRHRDPCREKERSDTIADSTALPGTVSGIGWLLMRRTISFFCLMEGARSDKEGAAAVRRRTTR